MKFLNSLLVFSSLSLSTVAVPVEHLTTKHLARQASEPLVGYMGVFTVPKDPSIYIYASRENNPRSWKSLNAAESVLKNTLGSGGVTDPALIATPPGNGTAKWYIIGTDLDTRKTNFDVAQRTGSRNMVIWESTDLVNWGQPRLALMEDETAGMVLSPSAIWDPSTSSFLVTWASRFFSIGDKDHTDPAGVVSKTRIRSAYTTDFKTFSPSADYKQYDFNAKDMTIFSLGGERYARLVKNEDTSRIFMELSENGLDKLSWKHDAANDPVIEGNVEGPLFFFDNANPNKGHMWYDQMDRDGYNIYTSEDILSGASWKQNDNSNFPGGLRHGSVLGVTAPQVEALEAKYGGL